MQIFDSKKALLFGEHFHSTLFYVGTFISLFSIITNASLGGYNPLNNVGILFFGLSIIAIVFKQTSKWCMYYFAFAVLVYCPIIYITTDGPLGGNSMFIVASIFITSVLYDGIVKAIIIGLSMSEYIFLTLYRTYNPDFFVKYPDDASINTAFIVSFVLSILLIYAPSAAFIKVLKDEENTRSKLVEELTEANDRLTDISMRDPVTGIYNKRYFMPVFEDEYDRVLNSSGLKNLAILLIDIDCFKELNESYGHSFGDYVLKQLVGSIGTHLREQDILARFDSREFAVLLPDISPQEANLIAERIRSTIASITNRNNHLVTASIGVSHYLPSDTPEHILDKASQNLALAKQSGKNRVSSVADIQIKS